MYMNPTGLVLKIKLHVKLIFSIMQAIYTLGHIVEHCDAWGYLKLYLYSYCLPVSVYLFVFRVFYISKFQMHWYSLVCHLKNMKCSNCYTEKANSNNIFFVFSLYYHPPHQLLFFSPSLVFLSNHYVMSLQQGKNQMSTSLSPFGTMPSTCQHLVRFLLRQLWQQDTHTHMHPYMHIHTGKLLFNSVIVSFRLHKQTRNKSPPNLSSVCGAFQTFYNLCLRQSPSHYCFCWDLSLLISPLP